jgi:iron complex outermembrane receptor protein
VCALAVAWLIAAGPAQAAANRVRFHIPPKPYSEALIDVAVQANISLLGVSACAGDSPTGLTGSYTVEEALRRLLAGAPCTWRLVARDAVQIEALAPPDRREAEGKGVVVDELLVTATKRVQSVDRLAVAVSVIAADQLRATGTVDSLETTGQLAGVQATNLGPGRDKLLLRGLSDGAFTGRSRSTVGTYLDDVPINYNAPDPDLRLVDVDRVEVLRGPQGALYGSGSLSGVYRIVTRKPDPDHLSARLGVSRSWTDDGAPSEAIEGFANLPLVKGAVGLRAAAYWEDQGGYLNDVSLHRNNVNSTLREGARLSMNLQPNEVWSIDLSTIVQHLKSNDTQYTTPSRAVERASGTPEAHDNDIAMVTATIRGALGWGQLVSSTGFVRHAYSSVYDASAVANLYTFSNPTLGVYSESTETKMLVQDLVLTSPGGGRIGWLAGLYATTMTEDSPSTLAAGPTHGPLTRVYAEARKDRIRELAAYGEASYAFSPQWTLALGGRLFQTRTRTASDVTSQKFDPRSFVRIEDFSGVSPKLSLQYEPAPGKLVYAVISEGYRAGGINSGGARPLAANRETFAPDRLRNYEIGMKLRALDQRLVVRSAGFYDVWSNIQTDQFRPSGIPYTTNVGDAATTGLELELSYVWDFGLSLHANGLFSRTHTSHPNPDYAPRLTEGLPGVPRGAAGLVAMYERPVLRNGILRLVGEASYVGRSQITFDPVTAPVMGGYVRAKLAAELSGSRWTAQVFVTNPANVSGDTFAFGNPFSFSQGLQTTPQRPRTIGLTVSAAL